MTKAYRRTVGVRYLIAFFILLFLFFRVTLLDGTVKERRKWETTHFDITKELSNSLSSNALISQVDGVLWHMSWHLEGGCHVSSRYSLLIVMRVAIHVGIRVLIFLAMFWNKHMDASCVLGRVP
ncbi:putative threonine--tRNA ligase [Helianthus anomalus]